MKKVLLLVATLGLIGADSFACSSGNVATIMQASVGLSSSFTISGKVKGQADPISYPISVSGTSSNATVAGYTGHICGTKGRITGTFSGNGDVASITLVSRGRKVIAFGSMNGKSFSGVAN